MRYLLTLAVLISCCAADVQVPVDAETIDAAVLELAAEGWRSQGLPDASRCVAPLWLRVSLDEFSDVCKHPSCAEPDADASAEAFAQGRGCAHACTHWYGDTPVALYAGPVTRARSKVVEPLPLAEIQAHETWHVWLDCTTGDVDFDHKRKTLWRDAEREVRAAAQTL